MSINNKKALQFTIEELVAMNRELHGQRELMRRLLIALVCTDQRSEGKDEVIVRLEEVGVNLLAEKWSMELGIDREDKDENEGDFVLIMTRKENAPDRIIKG